MPALPAFLRRLEILWALPLLALHAFLIHHYFFFTDDAYISFRYARNLMLGRGLVWNAGEFVEGYTNFLWTILLAGGMKVGFDPHLLSGTLSILCSYLTLYVVYRTSRVILETGLGRNLARLAGWFTVFFLSLNRSYNVWASGGLETRFFTLLIALSLYYFFRRRPFFAGLSMGLATLTRPDGLLFTVLLGALFVLREWDVRREYWRRFFRRQYLERVFGPALRYALPATMITGSFLVFRYYYYGQWLPNTYYAKVDASWPDMGLRFFMAFSYEFGYWLLVPAALAYLLYKKQALKPYLALALFFLPQIVYYCYRVGGDHFEWRIFDAFLPWLTLFLAHALVVFLFEIKIRARRGEQIASITRQADREADYLFEEEAGKFRIALKPGRILLRVGISIYFFILYTFIPFWPVYSQAVMLEKTGVPDGNTRSVVGLWHLLPLLERQFDLWRSTLGVLTIHLIAIRQELHKNFWEERREQFQNMGHIRFPTDAVTEDGGIGILGYYVDVVVVDRLGLTDPVVARMPRAGLEERRMMAHNRMPPEGYMERRGVNFYPVCTLYGLRENIKEVEADCPQARRFSGSGGGYAVKYGADYLFILPFRDGSRTWIEAAFPEHRQITSD
ncbi:MAG: hypothetical protein HS115_10100 [Spirochaetales bacterium]|nr:hypothetical protein [Spirochaetales bacterium]